MEIYDVRFSIFRLYLTPIGCNLDCVRKNVQVTLDVEKKNDQAPDSLEEEEEKEEGEKNGAKKAFSFPFVFVKDLK